MLVRFRGESDIQDGAETKSRHGVMEGIRSEGGRLNQAGSIGPDG